MIPVEHCPVCKGTDLRPFAMNRWSQQALHFAQARCEDCHVLIAQPQASDEELDRYYLNVYYQQKWPDPDAIWKYNPLAYGRYELPLMRKMWSTWPPPDSAETVEIGCGYGVMLEMLQNLGYKARGADPSARAIDYCHSRGLSAMIGKSPGLPWSPASFDLALALQVIEHMQDPLAFVHELVSLVKPGGVIVIATENAATSQYFAERVSARIRGRIPSFQTSRDHTFVFRAEHLKKMLLDAGCDEARTESYSYVPEHESLHWKAYKGFFRSIDRIRGHGEFLLAVGHRAVGDHVEDNDTYSWR